MIPTRSILKLLGIIGGLLIFVLGAMFFAGRNSQKLSVLNLGMRDTPWGPSPIFVITNSLPYRIYWRALEPEYELPSGWTITKPLKLPGDTRPRASAPTPLKPGEQFWIGGYPATNVAYRLPILWEIYPEDARKRPKWKQTADDLAERVGIRPLFLPHGIQRSPVIPPKPQNQTNDYTGSGN